MSGSLCISVWMCGCVDVWVSGIVGGIVRQIGLCASQVHAMQVVCMHISGTVSFARRKVTVRKGLVFISIYQPKQISNTRFRCRTLCPSPPPWEVHGTNCGESSTTMQSSVKDAPNSVRRIQAEMDEMNRIFCQVGLLLGGTIQSNWPWSPFTICQQR